MRRDQVGRVGTKTQKTEKHMSAIEIAKAVTLKLSSTHMTSPALPQSVYVHESIVRMPPSFT